jgi:hypothetical protein
MKDMKEMLGSGTVERRDRAACMQALHWCYVSASLVGKDVASWEATKIRFLIIPSCMTSGFWAILGVVKPAGAWRVVMI